MKRNNKICAILNSNKSFTELEPLSRNRSVSALPFACRYRIIDFMLSNVFHADIDSVALFIDTSGRSLYDHIRSAREWNLNNSLTGGIFSFSQQNWKRERFIEEKVCEDEGFYDNHRTFMKRSHAEYVVVMSGEHIVNIDINAVAQYFENSDSDATIVYKSVPYEEIKHYGAVKLLNVSDTGKVVNLQTGIYYDKNIHLNLGVAVMKVETLKAILDQAEADKFYEDIGTVLHEYLDNYNVDGFEYTGYNAIIDSIETYYQHNMEMLDHSKFNALFHSSLSIITRTKNGTPTYYDEHSNVKNTLSATGCDLYGKVDSSIIFRNVIIKKDSEVQHSIVLPRVVIKQGAKIAYAILDKGVTIDENISIIGSPDNIIVIPKNTHVTKEWIK